MECRKLDRGIVEIVDTESLVPKDHLLRKADAAVDFNRIYEMVAPLYSEDSGRPGIDLAVLFKMVQLLAALFDDALTAAGQFPKFPLFPAGNKAGPQKTMLKQISIPLRDLRIGIASRRRLRV